MPDPRVRSWLSNLTWDGAERLPTFFTDYFDAPDDEATRAVSLAWFIDGAARGSADFPPQRGVVPLLVGTQGTGKSSALRALVPWPGVFTDLRADLRDKWLCVLPDLSTTDLKVMLEAPRNRHVLFIGTTNEEPEDTRRFHPIRIGPIRIHTLRVARDQLWAEAVARSSLPSGVSNA